MTKLMAFGMPTVDDAEKLLLTEFPHRYMKEGGQQGSKFIALSTDAKGLALMDRETRDVFTSLPIGQKEPEAVDVLAVVEVTEEMLADPMINPAQEEQVTSLLIKPRRPINGQEFMAFSRIPGTDRFISNISLATLIPDSMSYDDSNVKSVIDNTADIVRDNSIVFSRSRGEICNICRPEMVLDIVPGYSISFTDIERTPENDSYPNIINPELKPPEHDAVLTEVEPVPEQEWLGRWHDKKAAWEDRMAQKEIESGEQDVGSGTEDQNYDIG